MTRSGLTLSDGLVVVGLALLAAGLGGFDWRWACIACGVLLLLVGGVAIWRRG